MNMGMLAGVLRTRATLRSHHGWSRAELRRYQERSLRALRRFATMHSPFYRELERGLGDAPLEALPIVTQAVGNSESST